MTETLYIEWVEFQLRVGVTDAQFCAASDAFQTAFLDLQSGYQHRALVRLGTPGNFADCVHWTGVDDMEAAMDAGKAFPECQAYFALLQVTKAPTMGKAIAQYGGAKISPAKASCASTWGGMEFSLFKPKPAFQTKRCSMRLNGWQMVFTAASPVFSTTRLSSRSRGSTLMWCSPPPANAQQSCARAGAVGHLQNLAVAIWT